MKHFTREYCEKPIELRSDLKAMRAELNEMKCELNEVKRKVAAQIKYIGIPELEDQDSTATL